MTKTQQLLAELKLRPMTGNELKKRFGATWTGQYQRLIRHGAIEAFQTANENSDQRYARIVVWKYRVIGEYCPRHGRLPSSKSIEKAIKLLTEQGYTVSHNEQCREAK